MRLMFASTIPSSLNTFFEGLFTMLRKEGHDVTVVSSPGTAMQDMRQREGVHTCDVPMRRAISPAADIVSLFRLVRVMRREKPHMVHSMTPKAGLLSMMAARIAGVPVRVHTYTGLLFPTSTGLRRRLLMLTDRITCACATHIIPEGQGVRSDLLDNGITRKELRVIGHGNVRGVDMEYYDRTDSVLSSAQSLRQSLGIRPDDFVFVFVGRVVADKGMAELAQAFKRIYGEFPNTKLLIVGRMEPDHDPLDSDTLNVLSSHPGVTLAGEQSDVRPWLAAASALVFPSYREGFPNVVLEAGAMGIPSVVTDINGSREIINEGINGLIVPSHDASRLYEAMKRLMTDKTLCENMAANARAIINEKFEQKMLRRLQLDFYNAILK